MSEYILEMNNIVKEFPGVKALDGVSLKIKKGEVHALCGENGAGKSTLMKILSGVYSYKTYEGEVLINGKLMSFDNTKQSEEAGVGIIYQELTLIKDLNVAENIFLGKLVNSKGIVRWDEIYSKARKLVESIGFNVNLSQKIIDIGIGHQQLIEIAKALSSNADILIMDEPTSALTETEVDILMDMIRTLKAKGITCIIITHKLNEVFEIADSVTVIRDGSTIGTDSIKNLTEEKIINLMVGRELTERYPSIEKNIGEIAIEVKNLCKYDKDDDQKLILDNCCFKAHKGEILGISGLMGAGRTELITSIFGFLNGKQTGEIFIDNELVKIRSPKDSIRYSMALLSEDRKRFGLIIEQTIAENMTISSLDQLSSYGIINQDSVIHISNEYARNLAVKAPNVETIVGTLSGGNQQKILLARCLMIKPKILFLDEPTRGIDIGAKYEIYALMNQLAKEGTCIIMVSSEMPEIIGMSDRVLVMCEGRISGEFSKEEVTQEKIMIKASGGNKNES
ncbi:MAG: ATP-binding cassette domain-containing protein [Vallitaleaceae bacterium]|nr:ATP-binding cassette domain-containing protein [Vallitaleaceae bacterium]